MQNTGDNPVNVLINKLFKVLHDRGEARLRDTLEYNAKSDDTVCIHRTVCLEMVEDARRELLINGVFNNQVCDMLAAIVSVVTERTVVVVHGGVLHGENVHVEAGSVTLEARVYRGKYHNLPPILLHHNHGIEVGPSHFRTIHPSPSPLQPKAKSKSKPSPAAKVPLYLNPESLKLLLLTLKSYTCKPDPCTPNLKPRIRRPKPENRNLQPIPEILNPKPEI